MKADHQTDWVGIAAGVFTAISMLPQLAKLIRSKKAEDISFVFLGILFCGLSLWIWYGLLKNDLPILVMNSFSLLVNTAMIILGLRYKEKKKIRPEKRRQPINRLQKSHPY